LVLRKKIKIVATGSRIFKSYNEPDSISAGAFPRPRCMGPAHCALHIGLPLAVFYGSYFQGEERAKKRGKERKESGMKKRKRKGKRRKREKEKERKKSEASPIYISG